MNEQDAAEANQESAGIAAAAEQVSGHAQRVAEQIESLRRELHEARQKADEDIAAAQAQSAQDVAAERRDRRLANWKFAIVVAVDLVLSAVSVGLYADQRATESKLHQTQTAVLCPLYKLFAQAIQAPRVGETDQQKAVRIAAQEPILTGYVRLGCTPLLPTLPTPTPPH